MQVNERIYRRQAARMFHAGFVQHAFTQTGIIFGNDWIAYLEVR